MVWVVWVWARVGLSPKRLQSAGGRRAGTETERAVSGPDLSSLQYYWPAWKFPDRTGWEQSGTLLSLSVSI